MANTRHHAAHPPSSVSPNLAVNQKPNVATGTAAPNPNPSTGQVGVDPVNSRLGKVDVSALPSAVKALTRETEDTDDDLTDLDLSFKIS